MPTRSRRAAVMPTLRPAKAVPAPSHWEPIRCTPPTRTVTLPRYLAREEKYGLILQEQPTCGFHIHVAMDLDEEVVGVVDRIRIWLPVLMALSSNSPYRRGTESGFASFRYQVWTRWSLSRGASSVLLLVAPPCQIRKWPQHMAEPNTPPAPTDDGASQWPARYPGCPSCVTRTHRWSPRGFWDGNYNLSSLLPVVGWTSPWSSPNELFIVHFLNR